MLRRRVLFASLVIATMLGMLWWMALVLSPGGWQPLDVAIWLTFATVLPWLVVGFWNGVIGLLIDLFSRDPLGAVNPLATSADAQTPLTVSTAILLCIRNEMPARLIRNLDTLARGLMAHGQSDRFHVYVLSDTTDEQIAQQEAVSFEQLAQNWQGCLGLTYRRRETNTGFKAGNIQDFCDRWGNQHDFALVLDADSLMSAQAVHRLIAIMQANPQLGILQGLVIGLPTTRAFTRLFQFGMRLGMRSYTLGSAWWQGDCGPYWGHNAAIRLKPFIESCRLPVLIDRQGNEQHILSHDQVEAVLMRRAGYDVRVYPLEDESFEENPPNMVDFVARDLRWCAGNMQYFRLLGLPNLKFTSRVQLVLAILMFVGAPAWLLLLAFMGWLVSHRAGLPVDLSLLSGLAGMVILMVVLPKLAAAIPVLLRPSQRQRFGGVSRFLVSMVLEFVFAALVTPVLWVSQAILLAGLPFGKRIRWGAQNRDDERVSWSTAWRAFGLHLIVGVLLIWTWWPSTAWAFAVGAYFFIGLVVAIPFAVLTSKAVVSQCLVYWGLCCVADNLDALSLFAEPAVMPPGSDVSVANEASLTGGS